LHKGQLTISAIQDKVLLASGSMTEARVLADAGGPSNLLQKLAKRVSPWLIRRDGPHDLAYVSLS
jgi:hypothetical protein